MGDTWDDVHGGDIVRGHDGNLYGVTAISHTHPAGPVVELVRHGIRSGPAQPPHGTPITIIERADRSAELSALAMLAGAGLGPELLGETYQP